MAKQMGIIPLTGSIGNITFLQTKDGFQARQKSAVNSNRIATDPAFQRTRENGFEFGRACSAGKLLRNALRTVLVKTTDKRSVGRLTRELMKVIQADVTNARGQRKVIDGDAELLTGFEFNENGKLASTFSASYAASINRVTGELKVDIPAFVPSNVITAPGGATHFKIVCGGIAIDFENKSYTVDNSSSGMLPWSEAATPVINLLAQVPANSVHPLFLALGIEFYQQVNGTHYPLKNGAFNALSLVKVSGE